MAPPFMLTAIGDTVNVASRLQDLTKEFSCHLVISEEVAQAGGIELERIAEARDHGEKSA